MDISIQNNYTKGIRDNLYLFRNKCQHSSMGLLESIFNYLIKKNTHLLKQIE